MNWRKDWEKKEIAEFSAMVHGDDHGKFCACWRCIGYSHARIVWAWKSYQQCEYATSQLSMEG